MAHFSKLMRPGAVKIGCTINHKDLMATAVKNPDGTIAVVVFNPTAEKQSLEIKLNNKIKIISIDAKALQTVIIKL
jgi:glucosylceramidase